MQVLVLGHPAEHMLDVYAQDRLRACTMQDRTGAELHCSKGPKHPQSLAPPAGATLCILAPSPESPSLLRPAFAGHLTTANAAAAAGHVHHPAVPDEEIGAGPRSPLLPGHPSFSRGLSLSDTHELLFETTLDKELSKVVEFYNKKDADIRSELMKVAMAVQHAEATASPGVWGGQDRRQPGRTAGSHSPLARRRTCSHRGPCSLKPTTHLVSSAAAGCLCCC